MQSRIVLISDDKNFFDYIMPKLQYRKGDELYRFSYEEIPEKVYLLNSSILIANAENNDEKALELLDIVQNSPVIIFNFNENITFKINAYKKGMYKYITPMTTDEEFHAMLIPAMKQVSFIIKNETYRDILIKNNLIASNNEVFLNYSYILEREIAKIQSNAGHAVLLAISPDNTSKFKITDNQIETIILNNIRTNDILMSYAQNKYFLLLNGTDIKYAQKLWGKIETALREQLYAGFAIITSYKTKEQLVSEVLNNLHEAIKTKNSKCNDNSEVLGTNFKQYRKEFNNKIQQIVAPVFYAFQQKYSSYNAVNINQGFGEGYGVLYIKNNKASGSFRISAPGFSKINIDILYQSNVPSNESFPQTKRINLDPEELESGLLYDLLEQFISDFKGE